MRSEPVSRRADEGFTLVEVLVALTVLTVAMTGMGAFFVNSSLTVAQQRDNRNAAVLASNALEKIRALEESALLDGRGQDKVTAQFAAAENGPFRARLKPYFDNMKREGIAGVTGGENAALPTEPKDFTVAGTAYKQSVFVGPCEVYVALGDDCVNPLALTDPKRPADAATILQYFRVVVLVSWSHKRCTANAGDCAHISSTLISRKTKEATFGSKRSHPTIQQPYMLTFFRGFPDVTVKMNVRGGNLPNHWSAVNLPDGLTINELTGNVSGTPTRVGVWTYATTGTYIRVEENEAPVGSPAKRNSVKNDLTWKVVEPPKLTLAAPPVSHVGDAVNVKPQVTGGEGPFLFTADPALPAGLTLNADGSITGTASKTYTTTLRVTESINAKIFGELKLTHTVHAPVTLGEIADRTFPVLSTANIAAVAAGGDGVYTYTATGLPVELAINAKTGVISGTPVLVPGRYVPTVTVTDGIGGTATGSFVLEVTGAANGLKFTGPTGDVNTVRGQATTLKVTTNATEVGAVGTTITVVGVLPPGLTWNSGLRTISGTPLVAGRYRITLSATSANPVQTTLFTFVWTVS
jgi:prepilin-type N-terminal cleavage/methylation domain-containing protein